MMTYLSQFPSAKLKPGAPLRPRTNAARVRAYGPAMLLVGLVSKLVVLGSASRVQNNAGKLLRGE